MSQNKNLAWALFLALSTFASSAVSAQEVCPAQHKQALRSVDVFDGPPEEEATLVPDVNQKHSGYWLLGYVYDANRIVTIRCKYANGKTIDVKLSQKIDRCDYKINPQKVLNLSCK